MTKFYLLLSLLILPICTIESSLINDLFEGARNLWPKAKDLSSTSQFKELPALQFEIPKENDEFLKKGLELINAPKEALDLCTHRVILTLKKKCNQLSLEEIGKLAVMLMNCQLEIEGKSIYPCKPEMTLAQCVMGFDNTINHMYHIVSQRALSICSAIKQQQLQIFTELAINRLMQVAQKQTTSIQESLQNQKRMNEMGVQNMQEYRDHFDKIKESQIVSLEYLSSAKEQIVELNSDLHRQLEIHQLSEQKLMNIEKTAEEIARNLESTNDKIVQQYNEAMQFMLHFKNIMEMISVVTSSIERVFEKIKEIADEIGFHIQQETGVTLILNMCYCISGMVFIMFFNIQRKYKRLLIGLFIFNTAAALSQADFALLPINILIWLSAICYYFTCKLKEKISMLDFSNILKFIKFRSDLKKEDTRSNSRARSKTPFTKAPQKSSKNQNLSDNNNNDDEDLEISDLCEKEMMDIMNTPKRITKTNTISTIPMRPETPSRPMTPAMLRVLQTDGIDTSNRVGTPFQPGIAGRIQCQAITNKGTQCRNAALVGYPKCKVHNYE